MFQIGLARWFVTAWEQPLGNMRCNISIGLTPQAKYYRNFQGQIIRAAAFMSERKNIYLYDQAKIAACHSMALDLSRETAEWCVLRAIINGNESQQWQSVALDEIIRDCYRGVHKPIDQVEFADLPKIWAVASELARQDERERARRRREWQTEYEQDWRSRELDIRERRKKVAAENRARELLRNWLTPEERADADGTGFVTVKSKIGDCRVPVDGGMVRCSDGHSYCLVFEDGSLPKADETLMKIVMLKTNPELFKQRANQWS